MPGIQSSRRGNIYIYIYIYIYTYNNSFGFLSNISFIISGICIFDAATDISSQSHTRDPTDHPRRKTPRENRKWLVD